jgi:hypothetical protein
MGSWPYPLCPSHSYCLSLAYGTRAQEVLGPSQQIP